MLDGIVSRLFGGKLSKNTAKNRLQMVLVQDRSGLNAAEMDNFRRDLLEVISRYFSLERKNLDIEWQRTDSTTALIINTPVVGRLREQIKAAVAG